MSSMVVAFPKKEVARNIRRILSQSGHSVQCVCTTGAQVLAAVGELESGIVVCGARFVDMTYAELYTYLPEGFQMLLVGRAESIQERTVENLVCLAMPLKVHELLQTVDMMEEARCRRRKRRRAAPAKRSAQEEALIRRAKEVLMERNRFTEAEAHRYIQRLSMEGGNSLTDVAQMILSLMDEG